MRVEIEEDLHCKSGRNKGWRTSGYFEKICIAQEEINETNFQ